MSRKKKPPITINDLKVVFQNAKLTEEDKYKHLQEALNACTGKKTVFVNSVLSNKKTILSVAAENFLPSVIEKLISEGAKLENNSTVLSLLIHRYLSYTDETAAEAKSCYSLMAILIKKFPEIVNHKFNDQSPINVAIINKNLRLINLITKFPVDLKDSLDLAVKTKNLDIISSILETSIKNGVTLPPKVVYSIISNSENLSKEDYIVLVDKLIKCYEVAFNMLYVQEHECKGNGLHIILEENTLDKESKINLVKKIVEKTYINIFTALNAHNESVLDSCIRSKQFEIIEILKEVCSKNKEDLQHFDEFLGKSISDSIKYHLNSRFEVIQSIFPHQQSSKKMLPYLIEAIKYSNITAVEFVLSHTDDIIALMNNSEAEGKTPLDFTVSSLQKSQEYISFTKKRIIRESISKMISEKGLRVEDLLVGNKLSSTANQVLEDYLCRHPMYYEHASRYPDYLTLNSEPPTFVGELRKMLKSEYMENTTQIEKNLHELFCASEEEKRKNLTDILKLLCSLEGIKKDKNSDFTFKALKEAVEKNIIEAVDVILKVRQPNIELIEKKLIDVALNHANYEIVRKLLEYSYSSGYLSEKPLKEVFYSYNKIQDDNLETWTAQSESEAFSTRIIMELKAYMLRVSDPMDWIEILDDEGIKKKLSFIICKGLGSKEALKLLSKAIDVLREQPIKSEIIQDLKSMFFLVIKNINLEDIFYYNQLLEDNASLQDVHLKKIDVVLETEAKDIVSFLEKYVFFNHLQFLEFASLLLKNYQAYERDNFHKTCYLFDNLTNLDEEKDKVFYLTKCIFDCLVKYIELEKANIFYSDEGVFESSEELLIKMTQGDYALLGTLQALRFFYVFGDQSCIEVIDGLKRELKCLYSKEKSLITDFVFNTNIDFSLVKFLVQLIDPKFECFRGLLKFQKLNSSNSEQELTVNFKDENSLSFSKASFFQILLSCINNYGFEDFFFKLFHNSKHSLEFNQDTIKKVVTDPSRLYLLPKGDMLHLNDLFGLNPGGAIDYSGERKEDSEIYLDTTLSDFIGEGTFILD